MNGTVHVLMSPNYRGIEKGVVPDPFTNFFLLIVSQGITPYQSAQVLFLDIS